MPDFWEVFTDLCEQIHDARRTDTPPPVLPSIHPIPKEAYHVFLR